MKGGSMKRDILTWKRHVQFSGRGEMVDIGFNWVWPNLYVFQVASKEVWRWQLAPLSVTAILNSRVGRVAWSTLQTVYRPSQPGLYESHRKAEKGRHSLSFAKSMWRGWVTCRNSVNLMEKINSISRWARPLTWTHIASDRSNVWN